MSSGQRAMHIVYRQLTQVAVVLEEWWEHYPAFRVLGLPISAVKYLQDHNLSELLNTAVMYTDQSMLHHKERCILAVTFRSLWCFPIAHCDMGKEPAATNMNAATVCVAIPNRIHP